MLLSLCLRNPEGSLWLVYLPVAPVLKMLDCVKFDIYISHEFCAGYELLTGPLHLLQSSSSNMLLN